MLSNEWSNLISSFINNPKMPKCKFPSPVLPSLVACSKATLHDFPPTPSATGYCTLTSPPSPAHPIAVVYPNESRAEKNAAFFCFKVRSRFLELITSSKLKKNPCIELPSPPRRCCHKAGERGGGRGGG